MMVYAPWERMCVHRGKVGDFFEVGLGVQVLRVRGGMLSGRSVWKGCCGFECSAAAPQLKLSAVWRAQMEGSFKHLKQEGVKRTRLFLVSRKLVQLKFSALEGPFVMRSLLHIIWAYM